MSRVSTYQIPVSAQALHTAALEPEIPHSLLDPLQSLVAAVSRRVAEHPLSIYVCADDDFAQARDDFAFVLARTLTAHVPSTLLIDCDFVRIGLHGRVPQKDALGFLDFLLYGSSIGVITQDAPGGVHVVGAGSFPVTKRMPFAEGAFQDAARRLVTHARCAVFAGPLFDEGGGVHGLTRDVDVVAVVRATTRDAHTDAAEESLSADAAELWSLRLGAPVRQELGPVTGPAGPAGPRVPLGPAGTAKGVARPPGASRSTGAAASPRADAAPPEPRTSSLAPRLAIVAFGVVVIAFVVWWLLQQRSTGGDQPPTVASPVTNISRAPATAVPVDSMASAAHDSARVDTTATPAAVPGTAATGGGVRANPADTGGRTGGTVLINPADIHVMDEIVRNYRGWFLIHISSFQESIRARDEVAFLQSREFPVFIVFLDLGAKGKWYRVYAGPFQTREEARDVKKNLDAIPQVRFTRIATIPE